MATLNDSLTGLYLEDSYLLGIVVREKLLQLHCLFALTSEHPAYGLPIDGEQHCYREGELRWNEITILSSRVKPHQMLNTDLDGTVDMGSIGCWLDNGIYHVEADWLDIRFTAESMEAALS